MTGFFLSTGWKAAWIGRGEKIRTSDPLHPMQVRYQAALRPDTRRDYNRLASGEKGLACSNGISG
jgi:hypothetical protein